MKKIILSAILVILILAAVFILNNTYGKTTLAKAAHVNTEGITKIEFFHQPSHKVIKVEDKVKIQEFISYLDECIVKKEKPSEHKDADGYIYSVQLYSNDKKVANMILTNPISVNGNYYNIIKGELSTEKIDNFLKDVK